MGTSPSEVLSLVKLPAFSDLFAHLPCPTAPIVSLHDAFCLLAGYLLAAASAVVAGGLLALVRRLNGLARALAVVYPPGDYSVLYIVELGRMTARLMMRVVLQPAAVVRRLPRALSHARLPSRLVGQPVRPGEGVWTC